MELVLSFSAGYALDIQFVCCNLQPLLGIGSCALLIRDSTRRAPVASALCMLPGWTSHVCQVLLVLAEGAGMLEAAVSFLGGGG